MTQASPTQEKVAFHVGIGISIEKNERGQNGVRMAESVFTVSGFAEHSRELRISVKIGS
jgi:hypothetical protein